MNPWDSASSLERNGVRREVFMFNSGPDRLFGSLYAATAPRLEARLVLCIGWGHDLLQLNRLNHEFALGVGRLGGAALLFHPPGHGDSNGSISDLTIQGHVAATLDAAAEGARRVGGTWDFAGVRVGASVAVLAAASAGGRLLPLIDPALNLPAHFAELRRRARRLALGRERELTLFGHPLSERAEAELPTPSPLEELARFEGRAAAITFSEQPVEGLPEDVETVVVPGRFSSPPGPKQQSRLASAAVRWIGSAAMASVAR